MKVYPMDDEVCPNCGILCEGNTSDDKNEFGDTIGRCDNCGYIVLPGIDASTEYNTMIE